jgi:VacB/RNase II family 3'-5' exoribonuclease
VFVHIADVASVVLPNSQIDKAAAAVPTSVYLPGHTRHMLPRQLAADALSLIPRVDRGALTVEMLITQEGLQRSMEIYPSLINSNERLSYVTAGRLLQGASHEDADVAQLVRMLHTAASRVSIQRRARGGVDAWRIDVTELNMTSHSEDQAHELIERLMVQTNEAVAHFLHDRAMPAVFRAHPELTQDNVDELQEALPDAHIAFPLTPRSFSALAARYSHTQGESMFWDAALSVMPKARYQLAPLGHFGLGSDLYVHFTSPLRRYADLLTHRVLHEWFKGHRAVDEIPMHQAVITINSVSRRAEMVERDARRLQALLILDATQTYEVVVTSSTKRDARVRFVGLDLQAFIPHAAHLRPGFRTQVRITTLDPLAQKLELEISNNKRASNKRQLKPSAQQAAPEIPQPAPAPQKPKSAKSARVTPVATKALLDQASPVAPHKKRESKPANGEASPSRSHRRAPNTDQDSPAPSKPRQKRSSRRKKSES